MKWSLHFVQHKDDLQTQLEKAENILICIYFNMKWSLHFLQHKGVLQTQPEKAENIFLIYCDRSR